MATAPEQAVATETKPILVLGLGNILLRDEGVGVRVVEALEAAGVPDTVELCDGGTFSFDLLDVLANRRRVIVVDAVNGPFAPGTVVRLTPDELADASGDKLSVHDFGLIDTLTAAARLGVSPQEVVIVGVQPWEVAWGVEMTGAMRQLVPAIVDQVRLEIEADARMS